VTWEVVLRLPYHVWCLYVANADEWLKATAKGGL